MIIKNAEHVELHKKIATAFFNLIEYKCLCCNKNYQQFDENLKGWFFNTCNNNRFVLLLQKGVYLYEYRMVGKKCNKTSLPEKEDFYSHLIMEDISDAD